MPRYPTRMAGDSLTPTDPRTLPQRLRSEFNFIKFPFFDLCRDSRRDTVEVVDEMVLPDGGQQKTLWKVSRLVDSKFPGTFAKRVHREVVERIVSQLPRPVRNPIRLGSFNSICRMLGINPNSGGNLKSIRDALQDIALAGIRSHSTFFIKNRRGYLNDTFHLYERVILAGEELPDGAVADSVYVVLGSWYLENINANYVVPLDFDYYRQLRKTVASRMYELLHHWFFVALQNNQTALDRRYSTLCAYFPLARQGSLWKARKQLRDAHKQHVESGYLAALPEWQPLPNLKDDWRLIYLAGPKAIDEYRRNQKRRIHQEPTAPDEKLQTPQLLLLPASSPLLPDLQKDLMRELVLRGISDSVALPLVQAHPPDLIQKKLEVFDWLIGKCDRRVSQNPAGYLRTSIEKNYATPSNFTPREERQRQAAEKSALDAAEKKAKAKAAQEQEERIARLDALWASLSPNDQEDIAKRARTHMPDFASKMLRKEEQEGRRSIGHEVLQSEIHKLLEAEYPAAAGA